MDFDTETFIAHTLRGEGFNASEDGTGRGIPLVPVVFHARQDPDVSGDITHPLDTDGHSNAIAFNLRGRDDGAQPELSDVASIRASQGGSSRSYVAFSSKDHGADAGEVSPTLRAMPHNESHANGGGQIAIASQFAVRRLSVLECARLQSFPDTYTHIPYGRPRKIESDEAAYLAHHGLHVWQNGEQWMTDIAADGNMYRALGNSMATCVVRWLGDRIRTVHAAFIAEQENAA